MTALAAELRALRKHVGDPLADLVARVVRTTGLGVESLLRTMPNGASRYDRLAMLFDVVTRHRLRAGRGENMWRARRAAMGALFVTLGLAVVARPAVAQSDLSGSWSARNHEDSLERVGGPYPVDYTGLPLNAEGRAQALAHNESQLSMIERQCMGWPQFYLALGPFGMKIWSETDPVSGAVIAWKIGAWEDRAATTIWMDGRPHPGKNALHEQIGRAHV